MTGVEDSTVGVDDVRDTDETTGMDMMGVEDSAIGVDDETNGAELLVEAAGLIEEKLAPELKSALETAAVLDVTLLLD